MTCETARVAPEDGRVFRKRPAAELRASIVRKCLLELLARIHHKWPMLRDGLPDWASLQQQNLSGSVCRFNCDGAVGVDADRRRPRDHPFTDTQSGAVEQMKRARGRRALRGWNRPRRPLVERDPPDGELRLRNAGP